NLRCGQPGNEMGALHDPDWAPLRFTFSGVWEVEPHWLEENLSKVHVLGELATKAKEIPKDKPIVAVCRAGSRSAHATAILLKAGLSDVANLPGGMLRWRAEGRGVEGGSL